VKIRTSQNAEDVRELFTRWRDICLADEFGISADVEVVIADLAKWLAHTEGTILLAEEEGKAIGFLAIFSVMSNVGHDKFALEKYWYAEEGYGLCGAHLFVAGRAWARSHECKKLMVEISSMSSQHYQNAVRFCEKMGMKLFETTYMCDVSED